ncbi:hypothetical protein [Sphingopyxis sp. BSNA05]|uniref:hypothetical protein n=1 Tax=Sphingopyxis sp. BSNA05 TaxID=1236614 RepID=UPI00349F9AA2
MPFVNRRSHPPSSPWRVGTGFCSRSGTALAGFPPKLSAVIGPEISRGRLATGRLSARFTRPWSSGSTLSINFCQSAFSPAVRGRSDMV